MTKLDQDFCTTTTKTEVTAMAELTIELLQEKILLNSQLYTMNYNIHKEILEKFLAENKQLEAIWTNDSDGRFIHSSPPNQIINANVRARSRS